MYVNVLISHLCLYRRKKNTCIGEEYLRHKNIGLQSIYDVHNSNIISFHVHDICGL